MTVPSNQRLIFYIAISMCCANLFILAPTMTRFSWQLYQESNNAIIRKRYPKVTLCICFFAIATTCCDSLLYASYWLSYGNATLSLIIQCSEAIAYSIFSSAYIWCMALRYWKMFYYLNWLKSTITSTWKIHLNSKLIERNWYLRHKTTLGSLRYSSIIVLFIWCLCCIASIIAVVFTYSTPTHSNTWFLEAWLLNPVHLVPNTIILLLWLHIPKIYDPFHIRHEFGLIALLFFVSLLLYLSVGIFAAQRLSSQSHMLMCKMSSSLFMFIGVLIQTKWVLAKNRNLLRNTDMEHTEAKQCALRDSMELHMAQMNVNNHKDYKTLLCQVLSREYSFENFMIHAANELALECLIGYIELTQFQNLLLSEFPKLCEEYQLTQTQRAILCNKCIPHSGIVHNEHNQSTQLLLKHGVVDSEKEMKNMQKWEEYKYRAYLLYLKYIHDGSELELNASYDEKLKISNLFGDVQALKQIRMNEKELYEVFDSIIHEQWGLLFSSLKRFVDTQRYHEQTVSTPDISETTPS